MADTQEYTGRLDIMNRACQWLGVSRIADLTEDSVQNHELAFVYGKLRQAALRRDVWRFSIKYAALRPLTTTTYLLAPAEWSATTTYPVGALAKDSAGRFWVSTEPENYDNDPADEFGWDRYFGPMTVTLYDSTVTYYAGELVYKTAGNPGSYVVFLSMQNGNTADPATANAWDATVTYERGDTVASGGEQWRSLIELNLNVTPATVPADWLATTTYAAAATALGSDGYVYTSVGNGNINNDPVSDGGVNWTNTTVPGAWAKVPDVYASALSWQPLYVGMSRINLFSPIGQHTTQNIFRLPSGFLRLAPQSPKQGQFSYLGASTSAAYDDWLVEGDYLVAGDSSPLLLRFGADVVDVSRMDALFCEGLACGMAVAGEPKIGQSSGKLNDIVSAQKKYMGEARIVNAIEKGLVELPEDDLIACRV